jgi:lipopolysaccharide transport system permease protein
MTTASAAIDPPGTEPAILELTGEVTPVRQLLGDLIRHWRLLPVLARQDFTARYRSASLGLAWSVFLPLFQGAILAVIFTRVVRVHASSSYPVFVIAGMNTWSYFSSSFQAASTSIVDTGSLAGRVYFPRLLCSAMPSASGFPSYVIANIVLVLLALGFGVGVHLTLLALPVLMAFAGIMAAAFASVVTMLHVYFRDVRYVVTALLIVWFYGTPVIYPVSLVTRYRPILVANPATGLVQATRWCIFGSAPSAGAAMAVSAGWFVVACIVALIVYRRHERIAVDRL